MSYCRWGILLAEAIERALDFIIGAISMLPGGMGTTEATILGLLITLSITASTASFAIILTRICTLWFAVIIGLIFLGMYSRSYRNLRKVSLFKSSA